MADSRDNTSGGEFANTVTILDSEVRVVEYRGHRVVTFKQIDDLHDKAEGQASVQFRRNRLREDGTPWFIEGQDFFEVTSDQIDREWRDVIPLRTPVVILLTERGYGKVTKGWSDDRSKALFDAMQDAYFLVQGKPELVAAGKDGALLARVDGISRMLAKKVTAIEARVELLSGMEARLCSVEEVAAEAVNELQRCNHMGQVTSLGILKTLVGLKDGQRPKGLTQFVTDRMRKFCEAHETWKAWKPDGVGSYLFPVEASKRWLREGGYQLIMQKVAEGMARKGASHQCVLELVKGGRS